jgi:hypothetical protein
MYLAGVRFGWGTAYAGGVRRLLLLGNPNQGYDYPFRHGWLHDFSIFPECGGSVNAPAPHTRMVCFGLGAVGGNTLLPGANHLQLGWEPSAMAQVASWLG